MIHILASLRVRFVILALLAVLPALGLLFYTVDEQRDQALERAGDDLRRLANLSAAEQTRRIDNTSQLLLLLAELPQVRQGNAGDCDALLRELLADNPRYANLGAVNPSGTLACSGAPQAETTANANFGEREFFRRAVETKAFVVGDYEAEAVTGLDSLICSFPVIDGSGNLLAVVYAELDLDDFLAQTDLEEGDVLTVFDRDGIVLAHSAGAGQKRGDRLAETALFERIVANPRDDTELTNEAGDTFLYAFAPLGSDQAPYAYLSLGRPRAAAVESANQAFDDNLTLLGLVTALVLVAAWVGGDLLAPRDTEANKALVRRVYEAFRLGNVDQLDEVVAAEFVDHDPMPGQAPGLVGLKQAVGLFRAAFPDGRLTIDEMIAEGNKVVARVTLRGTQAGEFSGLPPTGAVMETDGVETYLIRRGKIVESWSRYGRLTPLAGGPEPVPVAEPAPEPSDSEPGGRVSTAWWRGPAGAARALRRFVKRRRT